MEESKKRTFKEGVGHAIKSLYSLDLTSAERAYITGIIIGLEVLHDTEIDDLIRGKNE